MQPEKKPAKTGSKEQAALTRKGGKARPGSSAEIDPNAYDVELVPTRDLPRSDRSLLELDRRDLVMLSAGGGLVLTAIVLGWGIAQMVARPMSVETSPAPVASDQPQPQTGF